MKKLYPNLLIFFLAFSALPFYTSAQTVYDVNFGTVSFLDANRSLQTGSGNGQSAGDLVLYTNVVTVGTDEIDCIVRTISLTSGSSFTLPGGAPGGTNPHDYSAATGTGLSANLDRFFSPLFDFGTGGGSCVFRFEFIEDGSYNNTTRTGTPVILENVQINTYDIDGNGTTGSNQFNRFEQFDTGRYATSGSGGNITPSFNTTNGLTTFRSNSDQNTTSVTDRVNRIRLSYNRISSFDIEVGAEEAGAAYFFLDFSPSSNFNPTEELTPPVVDLDRTTTGLDNGDDLKCQEQKKLVADSSETNIITTSTVLFEMDITFTTAEIDDGANEKLNILGATSGGEIALNFANNATISDVVFFGNTFEVAATVSGGESVLSFTPPTGSYALAVWERLLDSTQYENELFSCTLGDRNFGVRVRNNFAFSPFATYTPNINAPVPVTLVSFESNCEGPMVKLNWVTASEQDNDYFEVQRSTNGEEWLGIAQIPGAGNSQQLLSYEYVDIDIQSDAFYRLKQVDFDGSVHYGPLIRSQCFITENHGLKVYPNPAQGMVVIELPYPFEASLMNLQGQEVFNESAKGSMRLEGISAGSYLLRVSYNGKVEHLRIMVH